MSPDRCRSLRCHRVALTVVALLTLAVPAAALAQSADPDATGGALAAERYYGSYGAAGGQPNRERAALAAERYLSSYGSPPRPAARTASTTVALDPGPSWTTAILAGTLLFAAAAGLGLVIGRAGSGPHAAWRVRGRRAQA